MGYKYGPNKIHVCMYHVMYHAYQVWFLSVFCHYSILYHYLSGFCRLLDICWEIFRVDAGVMALEKSRKKHIQKLGTKKNRQYDILNYPSNIVRNIIKLWNNKWLPKTWHDFLKPRVMSASANRMNRSSKVGTLQLPSESHHSAFLEHVLACLQSFLFANTGNYAVYL